MHLKFSPLWGQGEIVLPLSIILLIYLSIFYFNWRLITLQYCGGFCHTFTWISHGCTCVPHPDPPSHLPPHPIPQGHPSAPSLSTLPRTWTGMATCPDNTPAHCQEWWPVSTGRTGKQAPCPCLLHLLGRFFKAYPAATNPAGISFNACSLIISSTLPLHTSSDGENSTYHAVHSIFSQFGLF